MPVRNWGNDPNVEERGIWDTLVLGGQRMPGVARVAMKLPTGIRARKARGKRGAGLKDEGSVPRELSIELTLETAADRLLADKLRDFICGIAKGDPSDPLEILHDGANYFKITRVVLGDVDIDHPDPIDGWKWKIQAFEWQPEDQIPDVKEQKKRAKDDTSAWAPYRDDGTAGGVALPSESGAALGNLPNQTVP